MSSDIHNLQREQPILAALFVLVGLTLIAQLASLAHTSEASFLSILGPSVIAITLITAPTAFIGLYLGPNLGLGAPLLNSLLGREDGSRLRLFTESKLALSTGLGMGVLMLLIHFFVRPYLPPETPEWGFRGVIGGLLVSSSAAIAEEIWMRLGLLTLLAWLCVKALGRNELSKTMAWSVILISAFAFALLHLPQLAAAGAASPIAVIGTLFGNTVVGSLYGWLYWRHSLVAAIMGHFWTDVVIHVLTAIV